ncbi:MAG: sigma 54-interacting transcriptional regulator [Acidobacteria bacterium]|nr:sigma 54-interacting transcriptional regulator [Acidobacteriota bacterium]
MNVEISAWPKLVAESELTKLKTLQEIHRILDLDLPPEEAIARVFTLLGERHKFQQCMLSLLNERTREIRVTVAVGVSERTRTQGRYQMGEGITGRVVMSGRPVIVPDISDEPLYLNRLGIGLAELESRSFICVPVLVQGHPIGALSAFIRPQEEYALASQFFGVVAGFIGQTIQAKKSLQRTPIDEEVNLQRSSFQLPHKADLGSLIGSSNSLMAALEQALQVAPTKTTVLIRGESGTGKELVAEFIHRNSPRAEQPFIKVNCAALPESLIETELFGHERGAFTGAVVQRKGRFELADGGTIFLDEIGELSLATQVKLLRVLQEREFERVGGTGTMQTDVRLIAATNKDLEKAIADKTFREDLYYRLNVFTVFLPPLSERKPDILLLADHFIEKYAKEHNKPVRRISTPAIDMLMSYHWPGNVRELENCIERAVVVCNDAVIHSHHLPPSLQTAEVSDTMPQQSLTAAVETLERAMITDALKITRGNQARAATLLQVTERVINYKVKKFGISCERFR